MVVETLSNIAIFLCLMLWRLCAEYLRAGCLESRSANLRTAATQIAFRSAGWWLQYSGSYAMIKDSPKLIRASRFCSSTN